MDSAGIITYKKQKVAASISTIDDLKDDEIVEILVRLPLEGVFRCKCISKRWLALISDSSFVRSYIQRRKNLQLRHHFILYHVLSWDMASASGLYGSLPMPHVFYSSDHNVDQFPISDPSGKFFDFSFNFLPFKLKDRFRSFGIVRNSHGLLLCKGVVRSKFCRPFGEYYVCNPLTRHWCKIPPLTSRMSFKVGYVGFMCYSLDPNFPHKVEFIVLEVELKRHKKDDFFYTRFFSSQTRCWDIYSVACPPGPCWSLGPSRGTYDTEYDTDTFDFGTIVVYQGMFHWNGGSCLIAYDPLNEPYECRSIPIPKELAYNGSRIELSEGHLRLATYSVKNAICFSEGIYSVYQLTDYKNGKWDIKFQVMDNPWLNMVNSFNSETNGDICFVKCNSSYRGRKYVLYNMKTDSAVGDVKMPEHPIFHGQSFTAESFVMELWPTIVPHI